MLSGLPVRDDSRDEGGSGGGGAPLWVRLPAVLRGDLAAVVVADVCTSANEILEAAAPVGLLLHWCPPLPGRAARRSGDRQTPTPIPTPRFLNTMTMLNGNSTVEKSWEVCNSVCRYWSRWWLGASLTAALPAAVMRLRHQRTRPRRQLRMQLGRPRQTLRLPCHLPAS